MANYQIPSNLIDQLQILLRKEAHLESFNPLDSSLPSPPPIEVAISSIDLSDDCLQCKYCKGVLLRGSESIICIYCGYSQENETSFQPIPFKSTLGFGWLLNSLGLDPSESVGPPIDRVQSDKGQSSLKDDISLSDLLDLDLKWLNEFNRYSVKNDALFPRKGLLNLVGEDFDSRFAEGSSEYASHTSNEQPVIRGKYGNKETTKFENTESYAAVLRSDDGEHDESAAWEAEFQSAIQDVEYEHLQTSNASICPPVQGASHIDSIFQPAEVDKSAERSISFPPRSILTNTELSLKSGPPFTSKLSEGSTLFEDDESFAAINTSSSAQSPEDLQQKSKADPPVDMKRAGDDAIDEWGEFRTVAGSENNHSDADISGGLDVSDARNDFTGSVGVKPSQLQTDIFKVPNDDSLSMWNNLASESKAGRDIQLDTRSIDINQHDKHYGITDPMLGGNHFSLGKLQDQLNIPMKNTQNSTCSQIDQIGLWSTHISPVIQDDQLHGTGTKSPVTTVGEASDSLDFLNDFKSSTVERQQETKNIETDNRKLSSVGDSTVDLWNNIASLGAPKEVQEISNANIVASHRNGAHDDSFSSMSESFGAWNNFTDSKDHSSEAWSDLSCLTVTHADQHQSNGTQPAENHTIMEEDDLLNSWGDFRSSGAQVGNSFPSLSVTRFNQDQISVSKAPDNQSIMTDNRTLNLWGNFGPSTSIFESQSQAAGAEYSDKKSAGADNDYFNGWSDIGKISANPPKSSGNTVHEGKSPSVNDDTFDSWSDFASPINVGANSWVSNPANASDHKEAVKHDDPFDTWNVFVSCPEVQTHPDSAMVNESASERNLFETSANLQGVGPSSCMQADQLLAMDSDQNCSLQADACLASEVPDLFGMENGDVKSERQADLMSQSETTTKLSDPSASDVETLTSEMHDLSFMLESTLVVPRSSK